MRVVITTVGTSLISNFLQDHDNFKDVIKELDDQNYSKKSKYQNEYNNLKKAILTWLYNIDPIESCAEVKSLKKIKETYETDLDVKFLATDTLLSPLSAEIIVNYLNYLKELNKTSDYYEFKEEYIIKKTDVHNNIHFKEGIQNLIRVLEQFKYYQCIVNFSGGYKSLIPYLTIYASINHMSLCYIYEDSKELITIPPLHLKVDLEGLAKLDSILTRIYNETSITYPKELNSYEKHIKDLFDICTENLNGQYTISVIGCMLWDIYQENKNVELIEDPTPYYQKPICLGNVEHHGNDILMNFAKKLVQSEYVKEIIKSNPYESYEREFIHQVYNDGKIDLVLTNTDRGLGLKIQTTGRNLKETRRIADILKEKFDK